MPTIFAAFLTNSHISSTHSLHPSPEINSVAVKLEAAPSSETSVKSFYQTRYNNPKRHKFVYVPLKLIARKEILKTYFQESVMYMCVVESTVRPPC